MSRLSSLPHAVYIMRDASDTVLYVGCTSDVGRRTAQHSTQREWFDRVATIEVEHLPDQRSALERETELIKSLNPAHQITFRARSLNGWVGRRQRRDAAHDAGRRCPEWNCRACRDAFGPFRRVAIASGGES